MYGLKAKGNPFYPKFQKLGVYGASACTGQGKARRWLAPMEMAWTLDALRWYCSSVLLLST